MCGSNSEPSKGNDKDGVESSDALPAAVTNSLSALLPLLGITSDASVELAPVSGVGENSYGQVLRASWPDSDTALIVKMAPKNVARRAHMRVIDFYEREVFMYDRVFQAYRAMGAHFSVPPTLHASDLKAPNEFLIFEDLSQQGYVQNERSNMPTYDLVVSAIEALAHLHGCSFALQAKQPEVFHQLVSQLGDNLFTQDIEPVTIEFGKQQVRHTRRMLQEDIRMDTAEPNVHNMVELLQQCENHFKALALDCVNGAGQAPYAVICHGDFWNNNILYKHDALSGRAVHAKLIDFQMSRYAPPVLDLVHYLYTCTEKQLRDAHFSDFLRTYYNALRIYIEGFGLTMERIYPQSIFEQQLREFGIYGFIMAAFAMPFFISEASEIVDIDAVSEAIQDLSATAHDDHLEGQIKNDSGHKDISKCRKLVEEHEMLTERTLPIFKRRMTDIVRDLVKYNMLQPLLKLNNN